MIIVFDVEATDLNPGQICQFSYLMAEGGEVTGRNYYFAVDEMSEGSREVHRLDREALEALSGGERFEDRAEGILADFARAQRWVGHNVAFDERYLRVELERCGLKAPKAQTFCTMNFFTAAMGMERKVRTGRPKPPKLEELAAHFGVTAEAAQALSAAAFGGGGDQHDARYDAAVTYLCLEAATRAGAVRGIL